MLTNFIDNDGKQNHQALIGITVDLYVVGVVQMESLLLDLRRLVERDES